MGAISLRKPMLWAGLVASALVVVVIIGIARAPQQPIRTTHADHTIDLFSKTNGVDFKYGDLLRLSNLKSAEMCGTACCSVDQVDLATTKPNCYTYNTKNKECHCKSLLLPHPFPDAAAIS